MEMKLFQVLLIGLAFCSCQINIRYQPSTPDDAYYIVFHTASLYTQFANGPRSLGTEISINSEVKVKKQNGDRVWKRTHKNLESRGWNKTIMAEVLQKMAPLEVTVSEDGQVKQFKGYDSIYAILGGIEQPEALRNRLLSSIDTALYKKEWEDRWTLFNFIPAGVYYYGQLLDVEELNKSLKTFQVDSVKIFRETERNEEKCMDYYVYFNKEDSQRKEVEQFFATFQKAVNKSQFNEGFFENDPDKGKILKQGLFEKEKVRVAWRFSVNLKSGMPCYESKKEVSDVVLENARQEKLTVILTVFRENAFRYF